MDQAAALVSNLCPNASDTQSIGVSSKDNARRKWRKWIEAAALEWEKIQGGVPLHETYILDTQKKTDHRNTDRFLLSHGKLSGFRVCGTVWTFSGTVRVDPPWDDSEDLVEIARSKFMEAEGARERPDAITAIYRS